MDKERMELVVFEIVNSAGTAKGLAYEALKEAEDGNFEEAEKLLKEADEALLLGVNMNFSILLGNTFITSFGFVWTRFFIDSKRGFCKKFWQQYIIWGIAFGLITYFWMFRKKTI